MIVVTRTRFGYRQNDRLHIIFGAWWPFIQIQRLPYHSPSLAVDERLGGYWRLGMANDFYETGDPICLPSMKF